MSQFNFGSNIGANANQSGFGFGAAKAATPTFGTLGNAQQTQPSGSITFGTPIASVAPTVQNTGLSFGTPTLGTGLNFGAPVSTAPQAGLNFGTPTKPPTLNFGAPATQQPTLNFGTPSSQPSLNFGAAAPTPTATNLSFGPPNTVVTPNLSFGAAPNTSVATNLSFGAPPNTSVTPNLSFGAALTTPASSAFSLGGVAATTSTAQNPLGGISFAAPNPNPLGGINFSTPASAAGFSLGTSTATTPGLNFGTATPAASTGLNFGLGGSATSTTPGLNFKTSFTPASTAPGLNFGFNTPGKPQTTLTLGAIPVSAPIGLGGVDSSQLKTGTVTTGRNDTVAAKENQVPNEILQSIENFKQFVKDQKSQSSDVSRGSARPFVKVREEIDLVNSILTDVGNDLQRNQQQADKLKHDSAKCLHNAEMAQTTNDTPPGLQFENNAPLRYFIDLVNQFEQDLHALRVQIDVTDKHFQSLHEPKFLTSQELATGMRRLHDTFVALAGRLHSVHTQVESQKEQYLNLRKYILKDPTNIFIKPSSKEAQALDMALRGLSANKSVSGPTPFSSFGSPFGMNLAAQQSSTKPPPAYQASDPLSLTFGGGTSGGSILGSGPPQLGATQSLFGHTSVLGQTQNYDSSFQLQNPPLNKRGKR